ERARRIMRPAGRVALRPGGSGTPASAVSHRGELPLTARAGPGCRRAGFAVGTGWRPPPWRAIADERQDMAREREPATVEQEETQEKVGLWRRLRQGLTKTRNQIVERITAVVEDRGVAPEEVL